MPDFDPATGERDIYRYLSAKYRISIEEAKQMNAQIVENAAKVDLTYIFDILKVANTFDAHRLSQFAREHNLQNQLNEKLFEAMFTNGQDLGDHNVLQSIAESVGLEPQAIRQTLQSQAYADNVQEDIARAETYGIKGVPYYIINNTAAVTGAQPPALLLKAIADAYDRLQVNIDDEDQGGETACAV
jgi:predicted DsbA family dithiol-disulfide isomerase